MRTADWSTFCREHVIDEVDRINRIVLDEHDEYGCGVKTIRTYARAVISKLNYSTVCETCHANNKLTYGEYCVKQQ